MDKKNALEVQNLVKTYSGRKVVNELSFSVGEGEIVGLLGPNGAGKTTAFYMTVGLIRPESGKVIFKGDDVTYVPMHRRARMGMGYLAQEPSIFRSMTVEQNVMCILENLNLTKVERKQRLEELLEELHQKKKKKKRRQLFPEGREGVWRLPELLSPSRPFLCLTNHLPISILSQYKR